MPKLNKNRVYTAQSSTAMSKLTHLRYFYAI